MIELNDDKTLFFFDRDLEPVLTVKSGETVRIRTKDCFSNQLTGPQDTMDDLDWDAVNPATGPVFVEGAKAGGSLQVRIENIELDEGELDETYNKMAEEYKMDVDKIKQYVDEKIIVLDMKRRKAAQLIRDTAVDKEPEAKEEAAETKEEAAE